MGTVFSPFRNLDIKTLFWGLIVSIDYARVTSKYTLILGPLGVILKQTYRDNITEA